MYASYLYVKDIWKILNRRSLASITVKYHEFVLRVLFASVLFFKVGVLCKDYFITHVDLRKSTMRLLFNSFKQGKNIKQLECEYIPYIQRRIITCTKYVVEFYSRGKLCRFQDSSCFIWPIEDIMIEWQRDFLSAISYLCHEMVTSRYLSNILCIPRAKKRYHP